MSARYQWGVQESEVRQLLIEITSNYYCMHRTHLPVIYLQGYLQTFHGKQSVSSLWNPHNLPFQTGARKMSKLLTWQSLCLSLLSCLSILPLKTILLCLKERESFHFDGNKPTQRPLRATCKHQRRQIQVGQDALEWFLNSIFLKIHLQKLKCKIEGLGWGERKKKTKKNLL